MRMLIKRDPTAGRSMRLIVGGVGSLIGIAATAFMVRRRRSARALGKSPSRFNSLKGEDRGRYAET